METNQYTPALEQKRKHTFIYICAPLRGDVKANIERAREYAREVFLQGDIPICPHIYFPRFADVNDSCEDRAAMDMGLTLLNQCDYVNVYADPPTPGMTEEIEAARRCGIPIRNKALKRTRPVKPELCR